MSHAREEIFVIIFFGTSGKSQKSRFLLFGVANSYVPTNQHQRNMCESRQKNVLYQGQLPVVSSNQLFPVVGGSQKSVVLCIERSTVISGPH